MLSLPRAVGVHHVGLSVADLDRALAFYVGGLDLELLSREERVERPYFRRLAGRPDAVADIALLKAGARSWVELVAYRRPRAAPAQVDVDRPGSIHLALRVNDLDAVCGRLDALGVALRSAPQDHDASRRRGMRFVYCRDFDGALIELVELPRSQLGRPKRGVTLWITGLPAAGKTTLADAIAARLRARRETVVQLDGDALREGLNGDLGFSREDRRESARRTSHLAHAVARSGGVAIVSIISPYEEDRAAARRLHEGTDVGFTEIHVDTPLEVCEERDPKGLYARARRGELEAFTGVSAPFEPPLRPDLRVAALDGHAVSDSIAAAEAIRHGPAADTT